MSNTKKTLLRPEARPFSWEELNESQRDAFERIVDLMGNAVQNIDQNENQLGHSHFRSNQTLLLSGDRGMGKTSLMYSLMSAVTATDSNSTDFDPVKEKLERVKGRVLWLDTLDMEALPGPTNLLVSILARIEKAMGKLHLQNGMPNGFLNPSVASEKAQLDLRRLKADASLAWDGNIRERAAGLDPDIYAQEVMRAEHARLEFNTGLNDVVNDLSKKVNWSGSVSSPLFVLPVDDFDLNPTRCLELLRLIRAIGMPRLLILILGDLEILLRAFKLKMAGDFANVADVKLDAENLYETDFFRDSFSVASHALRKLIPPAQRIYLRGLTTHQALRYQPKATAPSLKWLLNQVELGINYPYMQPKRRKTDHAIGTLGEFLLAAKIPRSCGTEEREIYQAISFLAGPPREVADTWFALDQLAQGQDGDGDKHDNINTANKLENLTHLVHRWFRDAVNTDTFVTHQYRSDLMKSVFQRPNGELELFTENLSVKYDVGDTRRWVELEAESRPRNRIEFKPVHGHEFNIGSLMAGEKCVLGKRAESYLTLLHDLLLLSKDNPVTGRWLTPDLAALNLATQTWYFDEQHYSFSWPGALYRSFWEFDRFAKAWNGILDELKITDFESERELLACHWIATHCSILLHEDYPWSKTKMPRSLATEEQRKIVVKQLARVVNTKASNLDFSDYRKKMFLMNIGYMLSPEQGLSAGFAASFWEHSSLRSFWCKHRVELRKLRLAGAVNSNGNRQANEIRRNGLLITLGSVSVLQETARLVNAVNRDNAHPKQQKNELNIWYANVSKPDKQTFKPLDLKHRNQIQDLNGGLLAAFEDNRGLFFDAMKHPINQVENGYFQINRSELA